jgi:hypothetical protein
MSLDSGKLQTFVEHAFDTDAKPTLCEFIRIPNQSPAFEKDWHKSGHTENAVQLLLKWTLAQKVPDLKVEVIRIGDRTPSELCVG